MNEVSSPIPAESTTPDQVLGTVLAQRYSCRGFLAQAVPRPTIERILDLAQRTASWCNAQPWQVTITSGAATDRFRDALYAHAIANPADADIPFPREYRGVYLARRRECGFQLYDSVGIKRGDREASARQGLENFRLFGAPHVAIITSDEALGVYGVVDCGAYVSTFCLAARSLGVATIAQAAIASQSKFVRSHFGIGDDRQVVCAISFGYEDAAHPANNFRTRRAPMAETATWVEA
ncbi:MAG TPA: nitroreductase [Vineibacter sp.]|nr:nitroreductase [Vineibacter sp.]